MLTELSVLAGPRVAALATYLRVLPSAWATGQRFNIVGTLSDPANVKALITKLHGPWDPPLSQDPGTTSDYRGEQPELVNVIWNGNNQMERCLLRPGRDRKRQDSDACPLLPSNLQSLAPEGTLTNLPPNAPDSTTRPTISTINFTNLPTLGTTTLNCDFTTSTTECNGRTACVTRPVCGTPPPVTTTPPSTPPTTTQPPVTPTGGGRPPPEPTAYLDIVFSQYSPLSAPLPENTWEFFAAQFGQSIDVCKATPALTSSADSNLALNNVNPPKGTFKFPSDAAIVGGCTYDASDFAPGTLSCPELSNTITCEAHSEDAVQCPGFETFIDVIWKVRCQWG